MLQDPSHDVWIQNWYLCKLVISLKACEEAFDNHIMKDCICQELFHFCNNGFWALCNWFTKQRGGQERRVVWYVSFVSGKMHCNVVCGIYACKSLQQAGGHIKNALLLLKIQMCQVLLGDCCVHTLTTGTREIVISKFVIPDPCPSVCKTRYCQGCKQWQLWPPNTTIPHSLQQSMFLINLLVAHFHFDRRRDKSD